MTPSVELVRAQLRAIEASDELRSSERLRHLLAFLVEQALANDRVSLPESAVGNALYTRDPPYDPRIDSTVRVEARRLRRKLAAYYAANEDRDVIIELPLGTYVPRFSFRAQPCPKVADHDHDRDRAPAPGIEVLVRVVVEIRVVVG